MHAQQGSVVYTKIKYYCHCFLALLARIIGEILARSSGACFSKRRFLKYFSQCSQKIRFYICQSYFGKVRRKSNVCIIRYDWLIALYLFISLVRNASSLIVKNSGVREELSDLPFFLQTQLQQITVKEHIFGEFAIATLTFGSCTSPIDTFPFTYFFTSVPISIC